MSESTSVANTQSIRESFLALVSSHALLQHPFYQAWNKGELPRTALDLYARDYGAFVATIGEGWTTLGDSETAHEEEEHAELWEQFAEALGTSVQEAETAEVKELIATAHHLFSTKAGALGALYAFEVQQPETATSKLDGLRKFYPVSKEGERYFEEHAKNHHEAIKIEKQLAELSEPELEEARQACSKMALALWNGLSGIYKEKSCH